MASTNVIRLASGFVVLSFAMATGFGQPAPRPRQTFRDPAALELRAAITGANLDAVKKLSQAAGTNDCLELDEQGRTALHYAVRQCTGGVVDSKPFEILKVLAHRPGCVNAADRLGRKPILELEPLSWASRSRMDALSILIANGADVNAQDENGATILHQLLRVWDNSSLQLPNILEILGKAGINPNLTDSAGQSPVHYFFGPRGFCSNREGVRATKVAVAQKVFAMLAGAGANVAIQDNEGTTPVGAMLAQYETFLGTKETILAFALPSLSKTLAVNSALIKKRPALVALCDRPRTDPDLIARLFELGADAKTAEEDGFTALHGAAWFYNYRVCDLLMERGADVNAPNQQKRTPLHELARSKFSSSAFLETDTGANALRAAEVLLARGANRRLRDKDGKTALDLLKPLGDPDEEQQAEMRALKKSLKP
jgi:ankyrin repeat protein